VKYAIMLDPGHGGDNRGACANGILEKDVNWKTSVEVRDMLEARGIAVELTRTEDECPSLQERAQRARAWGADLLISIHHNAGGGGGAGYEIFKSVKATLDDNMAVMLAGEYSKVQKAHGVGIFTKTLATGRDYYGIIRYNVALGIPAIISEYCYLDSPDVLHINTDEGIYKEAEAIAKAGCRLCGVDWEIKPLTPVTPIEERIALAMVDKGWSKDPAYWQACMEGKRAADSISLVTILGKAVGISE